MWNRPNVPVDPAANVAKATVTVPAAASTTVAAMRETVVRAVITETVPVAISTTVAAMTTTTNLRLPFPERNPIP